MQLSIIIATYNADATLAECLTSCIEQQFDSREIIVIDGGSSDGTTDTIRRFQSSLAYWHSRRDAGIYDAWNQGLSVARGEYVCFIGADDRWADPRALADLFEAAGPVPYDLITSRGLLADSAAGTQRAFGSAWVYGRYGRRALICHPGLLHRRSLFETHGRFDTSYRITGDLDWLLRLPPETRTLHCDRLSVVVGDAGVSRSQIFRRLREQRRALSGSPRFGPVRAYLIWLDKLWRYPIARLLGLPY